MKYASKLIVLFAGLLCFFGTTRASAQSVGTGTVTMNLLGYTLGNGSGYYSYTDPKIVPAGSTQTANLYITNQGGGSKMTIFCGSGTTIYQGTVTQNANMNLTWVAPTTPGTYYLNCTGNMQFPGGTYPGTGSGGGYGGQPGSGNFQTSTLTITVQ